VERGGEEGWLPLALIIHWRDLFSFNRCFNLSANNLQKQYKKKKEKEVSIIQRVIGDRDGKIREGEFALPCLIFTNFTQL
jgi:hypothetical protein